MSYASLTEICKNDSNVYGQMFFPMNNYSYSVARPPPSNSRNFLGHSRNYLSNSGNLGNYQGNSGNYQGNYQGNYVLNPNNPNNSNNSIENFEISPAPVPSNDLSNNSNTDFNYNYGYGYGYSDINPILTTNNHRFNMDNVKPYELSTESNNYIERYSLCETSLEHVMNCESCRNEITNNKWEELLETIAFISAGVSLIYILDTFRN